MLKNGQINRLILCKLGGTQKRRFRSIFTPDRGNLFIIRREEDARYTRGMLRGGNAPGNQRIACKVTDILTRDSFRTTAGGNESKDVSHLIASRQGSRYTSKQVTIYYLSTCLLVYLLTTLSNRHRR